MTGISQSAFLQALGWATLNSFWQMALLWACFLFCRHVFKLSSAAKYNLAVFALVLGFVWFGLTFFIYFRTGGYQTFSISHNTLAPTSGVWTIILTSASVAYLFLLSIPAWRLFKNWRYVEQLRKQGLQKTASDYRIFVTKVAQRLGIKKTVHVYVSTLVHSPLTIGYLKPIILLPIAALNNLSPKQVEAVLLHELSHIRRYDYLVNFIVTLFHTLFYFNPFVNKFVAVIESEREQCCDELVLQFGYDKLGYASALLNLEKNARQKMELAIGATGKKHLLHRIEKIIGHEKKQSFSFNQFAGLMMTLLLAVFINSLFFVSKEVTAEGKSVAFGSFENPFFELKQKKIVAATPLKEIIITKNSTAAASFIKPSVQVIKSKAAEKVYPFITPEQKGLELIPVAFNEADAVVTPEQKQNIRFTLDATKKVLTTKQWQEVERSIGDGMTAPEKAKAKAEYLKELEKVNWKNLETRLKIEYNNLDWSNIEVNLNQALISITLDSIQKSYTSTLATLEMATEKINKNSSTLLPIPDASEKQVELIKLVLRNKIDSINIIQHKKIINF